MLKASFYCCSILLFFIDPLDLIIFFISLRTYSRLVLTPEPCPVESQSVIKFVICSIKLGIRARELSKRVLGCVLTIKH